MPIAHVAKDRLDTQVLDHGTLVVEIDHPYRSVVSAVRLFKNTLEKIT